MSKTLNAYSIGIKNCFSLFLVILFAFNNSHAQNAIVTENALAGNPYSDWGVNSSADFRNVNINGYATDISVNKGSTVHFKVDGQNGVSFTIQIYRLGYYNGNGARLIADLGSFPGLKQPAGIADATTGLLDCSNWSESASWTVPSNAVSGFYIAKIESTAGRNHIVFIVRDDASTSKILFQANDATWQAYNGYGGNNLYNGTTSFPNGHAVKVSFNRPFFIYNTGFLTNGLGSDWYMNDSYPMIRWLERNGYDMTYTTNTDVARFGSLLLNHKIFVTAGHDEYTSKEQRDNIEAARNGGVNCALFTGNDIYWKTRWEADANGMANRILVCYKEGTLADGTTGESTCGFKCDVSAPTIWTGLWRMGAAYDAPLPENALSGQISWTQATAAIQVPYAYKNLRFWRNTTVANLTSGQTASLAPSSLGYECDMEQFPNSYPRGRITLSNTAVGSFTHKLSLYKHSSGALVFGAGTVLWAWGLDDQHFGTPNVVSNDMQQATLNLFADMGVQPGSKQSDLDAATASTDVTAPNTVIVSPSNGSSSPVNTAITISGTASDVGGAMGGVEVSVDGGVSWQVASGTTNWTFSFTPSNTGTITIKSRGFDDSGNMEVPTTTGTNVISVTVGTATCPCHIFTSQTPSDPLTTEVPLELGVKFRSSVDGFITGIRFYKTTGNTGTHTGELYNSSGTRLGSAVFSGETTSGWQTVSFTSPIAITANTTYVAAYFSSAGNYTGTANYFTSAVVNSPLTGLADGTDGSNGVYKYTSTPAFPINSPGNKPNYWVDVEFSNSSSAPVANAGANQTITLPTSSVTLNGSGSTGTITSYSWTKVSGPNTPTITSPNSVSTTVTGLIAGTYVFQLSVNAGVSTSQVTITVNAAGSTTTIFTTQTPVATTDNDNQSTVGQEIGVKFKSAAAGNIIGIRFYKTAGNTGTHIGELYSSAGVRLAQATFTNETSTGWQTVSFSTPVAITANTSYTAAYFSSLGNYTEDNDYFLNHSVTNSPLTAPADGTNGASGTDPGTGQGTFKYTGVPAFPNQLYRSANYWVDVVFSAGSSSPVANAGPNQTITLPTSSVTLNGSGSTGTITSYSWTKVSGPNTPTITSPNSVSTTVTGLIAGTYVFQLSVNAGVSTSQVTIVVNPAPPPVANAGPNQTITLPTSSVTLNGSGSTGTITSYKWTRVSGPNTPTITSPNSVSTTVTGLIAGTYVFQLSVNAGVSTSQVTIVVNPAPPPVANAGPNQTITLPTSSVTLNGSGSTGTITSYNWTRVSGPNTPTITSPNSVSTTVTGLIAGTYVFQLSLNAGASTSQVTITVNAASSSSSTIFTTQTPVATTDNDFPGATSIQGVEDGVKFTSSTAGFITGIRFYKTAGNTGTHIGELYSSAGVRLAQATFTGETATGWQTVLFSSPVSITANTTYTAAYFSSLGYYTEDNDYFLGHSVTNSPLTAPADGTNGGFGTDPGNGQGTYKYTASPSFPNQLYRSANYWVDAIFSTSGSGMSEPSNLSSGKAVDPVNDSTSNFSYFLGQNYPNPAYQNTRVDYSIPVNARVELILFDMQGRPVKIMVNEIKNAGKYSYYLNTSVLAKGLYLYSLHSGSFYAVKKLIVQ